MVAAATSGEAVSNQPEHRCNIDGAAGAPPASTGRKAATPCLIRVLDEFRACMAGTKGATGQLSNSEVATLRDALSSVSLQELGLKAPSKEQGIRNMEDAFQRLMLMSSQRRPPITYLHIYEDPEVSVGIFCLPAGACIPLHNHPGMTVFSRLLYGQMFVQSFDWCRNGDVALAEASAAADRANGTACEPAGVSEAAQEGRPARLVMSRVQSPADSPMVLFPEAGGNLHTFTALTDCAVLDVLSPPYDTANDRDCTYYYIAGGAGLVEGAAATDQQTLDPALAAAVLENGDPASSRNAARCSSGEHQAARGLVQLVEYEPPEDFVVTRGKYTGFLPASRRGSAPTSG